METVDECVGKVVDATMKMGGIAMITADHGNAETMTQEDGSPMTAHTTDLVPFILCGAGSNCVRAVWRTSPHHSGCDGPCRTGGDGRPDPDREMIR